MTNDMSSIADLRNGAFSSARSVRRAAKYCGYAATLVIALLAYCELCALATNHPPREFAVSVAWALQASAGWIAIGAALGTFGERLLEHPLVRRHRRASLVGSVVAIGAFALACEALIAIMAGTEHDLFAFLYQRAPVMFPAGGLLVAAFLAKRLLRRPPRWNDLAQRAQDQEAPLQRPAAPSLPRADERTIDVMTGTGHTPIRVRDIECLEADRNYINVVHVSGRTYLLRQTMTVVERTLDPVQFVRVHRSTIVNTHCIKERRKGNVLILRSGRTVRIGRAFRERVRSRLTYPI